MVVVERTEENIATLSTWELEVADIIQQFYIALGFKVRTNKIDETYVLEIEETKESFANKDFVKLINFFILSENKLTALSDTNKLIMTNYAKNISEKLALEILLNYEKYNIKNIETAQYIIFVASKMIYQLCMKSVEGGERAYRGKIIKETILNKPEEEIRG
ncbi:MAG: hypothetical protein QXT38_01915 [Candidatus Aenigmatarchaeota archaeon]